MTTPETPSQLPATIPPDDGLGITSATFTDDQAGAIKALRWNGITKARAKRILSAAGGAKFLRQTIMVSVGLGFELPSAVVAEKMLKHCAKLALRKDTSIKDKIRLMEAFPGLKRELTKTIHQSILAAEKFTPETRPPKTEPKTTVNVGVNVSQFPPLAPMPERAKRGALTAGEVGNDRDRDL